uniref:Uncharacterized protein n=1 Tax=Tetradesmus obliquus TaxID=3088 RepID=A0A383VCP2_TETOB|eukprot:jgi/Sobl393_1/12843/SZX63328.1
MRALPSPSVVALRLPHLSVLLAACCMRLKFTVRFLTLTRCEVADSRAVNLTLRPTLMVLPLSDVMIRNLAGRGEGLRTCDAGGGGSGSSSSSSGGDRQ